MYHCQEKLAFSLYQCVQTLVTHRIQTLWLFEKLLGSNYLDLGKGQARFEGPIGWNIEFKIRNTY